MSADTSRQARVVGAYELVEKIAEGGMGAVYKGRHMGTGQIVAIKIIPPETTRNPLLLKRFEQEFKAATMIDHPNVVKALEYSGALPSPFLVMEFVDGESLGQRIERAGKIAEPEAVRLISQVCEGLHRAHKQGLIHRDVKPDNILVTLDGVAKLTDLGLVKGVEAETNLTRTGRGLGTPHFMAPEQFRDAKGVTVRCDVYSLAATLYAMVTGATPFHNTTPLDCWLKKTKDQLPAARDLVPGLSARLDWAVRRAMLADPAARPASCREFMEDLTGTGWLAVPGSGAYGPPGAGGATAGPSVTTMLAPGGGDVWYLVYKDAAGGLHTVKGATDSIRKNLAAGSLGDAGAVLVSRTKTGQFLLLRNVPEFRDLALMAGASGRLQSTVFPIPARNSLGARTPAKLPETDRLNVPDPPAQSRTDTYEVEPVLGSGDVLTPAPRRADESAAPPRPTDWAPWAILAVVLAAAAVGLAFVLWL